MNNKLSFILLVIIALYSCSSIDIERSDLIERENAVSNESVFYHQPSGLYLKHQNDPFSLANMQAAYDKVVATKGDGGFFQQGGKLSPTHFALKIYPRTLKEWSTIDNMDDIKVSYYPFDYTPVPGEVVNEDDSNSPFEKSKYSETCTYKAVGDDTEKEETISLPILYVVWPADKELPQEYDYVVDYGVFIPSYAMSTKAESGLSLSEKRTLEREALVLALGEKILLGTKSYDDPDDSANFKVLTGSVSCFDSTYFGLLPLPNVGMKFELGTFIYDASANDIGTFDITIETEYHPYLNFSFYFRTSQYEVRLANSSSYYQLSLGTVASVFGPDLYGHRDFDLSYLPIQLLRAQQAAAFYYRGSHEMYKHSSPGVRVVIKAFTTEHPSNTQDVIIQGTFSLPSDIPTIKLYHNRTNRSSEYISAVLHEFGHYLHYGLVGYDTLFNLTQPLIFDSFASFVGWSLGRQYYQQHNCYLLYGIDAYGNDTDETGEGRQNWTGPSNQYSPLFVDLQDTYNQCYSSLYYVFDAISGVPYSAIQSIITTCTSWTSVRQALATLVNTYYTQSEFDAFVLLYGN